VPRSGFVSIAGKSKYSVPIIGLATEGWSRHRDGCCTVSQKVDHDASSLIYARSIATKYLSLLAIEPQSLFLWRHPNYLRDRASAGIFQLLTFHHHLRMRAPTLRPLNCDARFQCRQPAKMRVHIAPCARGKKTYEYRNLARLILNETLKPKIFKR
jgi:hypothetical protein